MFEHMENLRREKPLIHCITNPISINLCANGLLAIGAQPIMAEHPEEVGEITGNAKALLLNLGNITDVRMLSMKRAARAATERNIPIVVDAVGIACSRLRRDYLQELLSISLPTAIKGNYSEIQALYQENYHTAGVDADATLTEASVSRSAVMLARQYSCIILASGQVDIVTDGIRLMHIKNGTSQLATVTGTGCLLGALCAAFLAVHPNMDALVAACAILGICGELAQTPQGTGSFAVQLLDELSTVQTANIQKNMNMEEIDIENL